MLFWVKSPKIDLFQFEKSDSESVMHTYVSISLTFQSMIPRRAG